MATENKKKASEQLETAEKSKGLNSTLWAVSLVLLAVAAIGNTYFASHFSFIVRSQKWQY